MFEIKSYSPDSAEVSKFRELIYVDDLELSPYYMKEINHKNQHLYNKFAYWFSDKKFLGNNFDRVLIYYDDGQPVAFCGGTHYNQHLYRCLQNLYIIKSARKKSHLNTLHFKENGFFDIFVQRAKELGCQAAFYSVDPFDQRHLIMYRYLKDDRASMSHMPMKDRKYTAKDFTFIDDKFYNIKNTNQYVAYYNLTQDSNIDFDQLFNDS